MENLRYLDLTSNKITNKGGLSITKIGTLGNLYLSHNKIQACIAIRLSSLPELKVLDLRFNDIEKEEKSEVKNKSPESLQIFV